jgi:hypothetical protein
VQIDFHHATTYVLARLAGFTHEQADVIGYSAEYVDDATNDGLIRFDNGALYNRIASAHKMLDYDNLVELKNHLAWIPFHFLPGNGGLPAGQSPDGGFSQKLICRPDSPVARDMLALCIRRQSDPAPLERLGITMHVYVDTWAHQGFAGVSHEVNRAKNLLGAEPGLFGRVSAHLQSMVVGNVLPLGHGAVLSCPDRPYLTWTYENYAGEAVVRDNTSDFMIAAEAAYQAMARFRAGDASAPVAPWPQADRDRIHALLKDITHDDGEQRHAVWLERINEGHFSFGPADLRYVPKGRGSWKHAALGTERERDEDDEKFPYTPRFLESRWKHFHDAAQAHRLDVLHVILPRYGVCAA